MRAAAKAYGADDDKIIKKELISFHLTKSRQIKEQTA